MSCQLESFTPLGNAGGFSGARLWKVVSPTQPLCLRRWPRQHPPADHLGWIHHVLRSCFDQGCSFLPVPLLSDQGQSFVRHDGCLWELAPWMPGAANYGREPKPGKLTAAMVALAQFHLASAEVSKQAGRSRAVTERIRFAEWLNQDGWELCHARTALATHSSYQKKCSEILRAVRSQLPELPAVLTRASRHSVTLQPCLRDIWHDHVYFDRHDQVSGLIDFGAMRMESVAVDVARLTGSLVGEDSEARAVALRAYEALRPLSPAERELVEVLDQANKLLAGMNWVRWLMVEEKQFDVPEDVHGRMDSILARLR